MPPNPRVQFLNTPAADLYDRNAPVIYWMQSAVRAGSNHALEYAIHLANYRQVPLQVCFVLVSDFPAASSRHYRFLLEGVGAAAEKLRSRGIPFSLHQGDPRTVIRTLARHASTVVTDRGYTRILRDWRRSLAESINCPLVEVDTNAVIPVETASPREEYSAATFRRKIRESRDAFLTTLSHQDYWMADRLAPGDSTFPSEQELRDFTESDPDDSGGQPPGGEDRAREALQDFLEERLLQYNELRNVPDRDWTSRLSPYLHFGQISPIEIALRAKEFAEHHQDPKITESTESFLEELIVRRELAINFVWYNRDYDRFSALPDWARRTLHEHSGDNRPALYTARQLENAETQDPYWNAAQRQMVESGRMHGYMRMYWGKKILEWTQDPEDAYSIALEMNDRWQLDGRDPNGYAGVAWCFGKHDRPWAERPVFGMVRYMNDNGLKRKFKEIDRYVRRWTDSVTGG